MFPYPITFTFTPGSSTPIVGVPPGTPKNTSLNLTGPQIGTLLAAISPGAKDAYIGAITPDVHAVFLASCGRIILRKINKAIFIGGLRVPAPENPKLACPLVTGDARHCPTEQLRFLHPDLEEHVFLLPNEQPYRLWCYKSQYFVSPLPNVGASGGVCSGVDSRALGAAMSSRSLLDVLGVYEAAWEGYKWNMDLFNVAKLAVLTQLRWDTKGTCSFGPEFAANLQVWRSSGGNRLPPFAPTTYVAPPTITALGE